MADINTLIIQDEHESDIDFNIRKELTLKISNNMYYPLNNMTSIVMARMLCNKMKLGVTYDDEVEIILEKIISYIK